MKKILFQGDSITDKSLWAGYPAMVEGAVGVSYPNCYEFENRGISGNRIVDLLARIKADIINLQPDYLSILIGVNDVWHEFDGHNGVSAPRYKEHYDYLISQILEEVPGVKIMILEPFALKGDGNRDYYDEFRMEVEKRAAAAREIAEKHGLPFVELQKAFDDAAKLAPENFWLADGVHPTYAGHKIIADKWIEVFETIRG